MYHFLGRLGKTWELKLNYRCKKEEQKGEGPGSCSNNLTKVITIKFVPSKTIDESQQYAADNILDPSEVKRVEEWNSGRTAKLKPEQVQQIKLINYRGIDIKVANIINKQLIENISIGLPRPKKIIATQLRKTPNTLMRMGSSGDLELNTIAIGNFKKINATLDAGKQLKSKANEMTELESKISSMNKVQKMQYDDIKEYLKYDCGAVGYELNSTPERALQASINHEIAHMLEKHGKYGYDTPSHEEFGKAIIEMAKITINSDYRYKLSAYGCKGIYSDRNPDGSNSFPHADYAETFAELYSLYRFHEDERIHPKALEILKKWLPER